MKLNDYPLPILAPFFLSDFNHAICMLTIDPAIDEDAGTPFHTQAFSASFLSLFCLKIVQLTLLLAYLLCPIQMKNDYFPTLGAAAL